MSKSWKNPFLKRYGIWVKEIDHQTKTIYVLDETTSDVVYLMYEWLTLRNVSYTITTDDSSLKSIFKSMKIL